jgi:NAD(P)-dependent dehydrogenase (short-subunit alcohol dehydrogenase family)
MVETEIHELSSGDPGRERIRPMIPLQRIGKPQEIADAVMYLLGDKSSMSPAPCCVSRAGAEPC